LPAAKPRPLRVIAWSVVREPMLLLLVAAGTLYLLLGDVQEAFLLIASIGIVVGITLYQEQRTERALERLRDWSSPRALVIRGGRQHRIPGREVVRGDLVVVAEGDRVPADGVVLQRTSLSIDESLLTGESVPVRKVAAEGDAALGRPGGDDLPGVFSGTLVVQGSGVVRIAATGAQTELGRIGRALQTVVPMQTALQRETGRLVRRIALFAFSFCVLIAAVYAVARSDVLGGLLAGVALAMSLIPEEFPVVLSVFLALGAWRIAQQRVLTRRVPALETLGAATVLCVDKTGTLTLNQMAVRALFVDGRRIEVGADDAASLPEAAGTLVATSMLASPPDPFDPMEQALVRLGRRVLPEGERHEGALLVRQYPLSPALLAMVNVWQPADGGDVLVAAKGAPEAIAELCRLDAAQRHLLLRDVQALAEDGLRVLGVARAAHRGSALPQDQHAFAFTFVGLVALADPVRPGVPAAVQDCTRAGIRVVMITGDYPVTARSIGRQIGLPAGADVVTGAELDSLDDSALAERIAAVNVFARVGPEQKLRLVKALQANGEIVAMTGDGVNDAPALRAANIGIAMGGRGTDVAREAASLVLLEDDFTSIVGAVRQGRRIYDNIKKAFSFVLAMHVPIAGIAIIPIFFGLPLVLLPAHIVFLEMIIDPACSLVFEAELEEADVMQRPPRNPQAPLFSRRLVLWSLGQGASILAAILAVFVSFLLLGNADDEARAVTFATLVVGALGLIVVNRSWSRSILATIRTRNPFFTGIVGGTLLLLVLVLVVPFLRDLFRFAPLHPDDAGLALIAGIMSVGWFDFLKRTGVTAKI
jgi:P-type Ca2+ transporter type 2C